ncbi:lysM domain-containing protein [Colletotrichum asianum]|uniref:LysM domain-containing protein n=1 Tax=Colletotrichum asianum TaxID=702518 RepID=A0A8H3ZQG8_9PEZI|nr:lysM domain-containing protein [Colletotrichum asianum]
MKEGDTCDSIAAAISNDTNPITAVRLATKNPNVLGACDSLVPNQYVCITRRGGSWIGPPESEIPDDGEEPVRGGREALPVSPFWKTQPRPPANVQEGIAPGCNRYVQANSTVASCWKIANDAGIKLSFFYEWNTMLASGDSCDMIWPGYFYCIGVKSDPPTTTTHSVNALGSGPLNNSKVTCLPLFQPLIMLKTFWDTRIYFLKGMLVWLLINIDHSHSRPSAVTFGLQNHQSVALFQKSTPVDALPASVFQAPSKLAWVAWSTRQI